MRICVYATRIVAIIVALAVTSTAAAAESPPWATRDLRAGIIGTDTSHVPAFTGQFQSHPEWRIKVVAAFKGGCPDQPASAGRVWRRIPVYSFPARLRSIKSRAVQSAVRPEFVR